MQKTFQLLRRGDIEAVRQILDRKPEEVNAVSGDKPKRDQGQSLLQVAIKSGQMCIRDRRGGFDLQGLVPYQRVPCLLRKSVE